MSANESFGASAAKASALVVGSAMTKMPTIQQFVGTWGQVLLWGVTLLYGILQLVKALPWLTDYYRAVRRGLRDKDWSHWWAIARRSQRSERGE